jgi:leucyl-tRNA synthetase
MTSSKQGSRSNEAANYVLKQVVDAQVRMLAPVTPHVCEELWEKVNGKGFVSQAAWPSADPTKVDARAEESEALVAATLQDTLDITKATGMKPKKIYYYTAAEWKRRAYALAVHKSLAGKISQGDLMKELLKNAEMKKVAGQLARFVGQSTDEINKMSAEKKQRLDSIGVIDENEVLKEADDFFQRELNAEVHVCQEEDLGRYDPKNRAQLAKPYRPAIYIE